MLEEFSRSISSNLGRPEILGGLLQDFLAADGISHGIRRGLRRIADGDQAVLRQFSPNGLVLIDDPGFRLFVEKVAKPTVSSLKYHAPRNYLHSEAANTVAVLRTFKPLKVERFVPERPVVNEVFEAGVRLILSESFIYDGRPVITNFDEPAVFRWTSKEAALMLKLAYRPYSPQTWLYDAETLTSAFAAAIDPAASAMVAIARTLGALHSADGLPFLHRLRAHPHHFVRWAAVQAAGRIDAEVATTMLRDSLSDPHPFIRRAAERALARAA